MICVWEISCKLKLIKCILPTDKPYYCIPGYCPLSGKHFFFFCPNSILQFDFLPYAPAFYISTCHMLTKRNLSCHHWKYHNESPKISKEQVPRNTCRKCGAVAATLLCVCVWCPHRRTMAVSFFFLFFMAVSWVQISTVWILNSCAALQSHPYWYL